MKRAKYIITTLAALMVVSTASNTLAASKGSVIYYNNEKVNTDKDPILKDGTTYVPLRLLATLFGKDVSYDSKTGQINITDKTSSSQSNDSSASSSSATSSSDAMEKEIADLQAQIRELKDYVATTTQSSQMPAYTPPAQTSVTAAGTTATTQSSQMPVYTPPTQTSVTVAGTTASATTSTTATAATPALSMNDLQSVLNGTDFLKLKTFQIGDISLSGDGSNLSVEFDADLKYPSNNEHWNDLQVSDIQTYLTMICNRIRQNYPTVNIAGTFKNTSFVGLADTSDVTTTTQYLANFTCTPAGTVNVTKLY